MMSLLQPEPDGFTVKIMPKPSDVEGLADVLIGSLGLAGAMVLARSSSATGSSGPASSPVPSSTLVPYGRAAS